MKSFKIILHLVLIISVITAVISGFNLEMNNIEYMPESEANKLYSRAFYDESARILESIGVITEYLDEYKDEQSEVVDGITVANLIEQYMNDYSQEEYELLCNNMFVYNAEDLNPDGSYSSYDGNYYDSDHVKKYGYTSEEEWKADYDKYTKIIDYFYIYEEYSEARYYINHEVSNLKYVVRFTDAEGNQVVYPENYNLNIEHNAERFDKQFLYDKISDTSYMNNLSKTHAQFDTLVYKCKTFTDYSDFYALFAVDNTYPHNDEFYYYGNVVVTDKETKARHNMLVISFFVSALIAGISLSTLMFLTGKKGKGEIQSYVLDKIWWDILGVGILGLAGIIYLILRETDTLLLEDWNDAVMMQFFIGLFIEVVAIYLLSIVRRIKHKQFLRSSILGKGVLATANRVYEMWNNLETTKKAISFLVIGIVYTGIASLIAYYALYVESVIAIGIWCLYVFGGVYLVYRIIWKFYYEYDLIKEETKNIAEGNIYNKINIDAKFKSNRNMAEAVNSIGDGISRAVDENVKNERMKTDLITNVSHDIKTPLTSIINYVNLLKMEDIKDEKVNKYINILEEKSNRLKVLTDDLVEASKLSSGVIKLDMNKLNLVELIRQSAGEFEEKFEEKKLEIVMNLPMSPVYVLGDGRKMWRVLENLYGNIYKYAMKGTRVYVDLGVIKDKVVLNVKNISDSSLNFQSDELTERFIRGDVSRSTEGSGLGLSIAKSIIDRHGGEFKIVLDGDLFKIIIKLDEYRESQEVKK